MYLKYNWLKLFKKNSQTVFENSLECTQKAFWEGYSKKTHSRCSKKSKKVFKIILLQIFKKASHIPGRLFQKKSQQAKSEKAFKNNWQKILKKNSQKVLENKSECTQRHSRKVIWKETTVGVQKNERGYSRIIQSKYSKRLHIFPERYPKTNHRSRCSKKS